jgi:hypothetical protein
MTVYKITSTTSRFTSSSNAFEDGTTGADSLTVDDGAYLVATGSPYDAAHLDSHGAWKVTVNGSVYAASVNGFGIYLTPGNTAASTITIGATGEVAGGATSIYAYSPVKIQNAGLLVNKVVFNGGYADSLTNTGTIGQDFVGGTIIDGSGGGAITVKNSGDIFGNLVLSGANDTVTNSGTMGQVDLGQGDNKLTTTAKSSTGIVYGGLGKDTLSIAGSVDSLQLGDGNNAATLAATGTLGSYHGGAGNDVLKIAGEILGDVDLGEGTNSLTLTGTLNSISQVSGGGGNDTITNSGYLSVVGGVHLGNGTDKFTNSKTFIADLTLGSGSSTVTNSGTFTGDVVSGGQLTFTNSGTFTSASVSANGLLKFNNTGIFTGFVLGSLGDDTVTNKKTLNGIIVLNSGTDTVTNSGIINGDVNGSGHSIIKNTGTITGILAFGSTGLIGADVTNSGTIEGNLAGHTSADHVTNTGHIYGIVDLNSGDDNYTGGNFVDYVADGAGSDTVKLGGGNDIYDGDGGSGDGTDTIDGGAGIDTFLAQHSSANSSVPTVTTTSLFINIDTVNHIDFAAGGISANFATGAAFNENVYGFENVIGGNAVDVIYGNAAVNILEGRDGADVIYGYGGKDEISGDAGADIIGGGAGADRLEGGADADRFIYSLVTDSGPGKAARDTILDFQDGVDHIDLHLLDSDSKTTGTQQNMHFVGTNVAFGMNDPGEVRAIQTAGGYTIEADVSGDGKADFAIDISDTDHSIVFSSSDFLFA